MKIMMAISISDGANVQILNQSRNTFVVFRSKDFLKACELIRKKEFENYDLEDDFYCLFGSKDNSYWSVAKHNGRYYLTVEDTPIIPLGKLQKHIEAFVEEKEAEIQAEWLRENRQADLEDLRYAYYKESKHLVS